MSNKTVTRAFLADVLYREIGFSAAEASDLVDSVFKEISLALESGDSVKISGFGSFHIREKNARTGRNPRTKEEAVISSRKVVSFYASDVLKKYINPHSDEAIDIEIAEEELVSS